MGRVEDAITRTAVQVGKLRAALDVFYQTGERRREAARTGDLINRLLGVHTSDSPQVDDAATAYPLRRLAEFGLLPGYESPSEPATLRLLGDDDEQTLIQSGRELGLRQYQPNAPVYARGRRWKVLGVDVASPWNPPGGQAPWRSLFLFKQFFMLAPLCQRPLALEGYDPNFHFLLDAARDDLWEPDGRQ